jgi:hypothetical protein
MKTIAALSVSESLRIHPQHAVWTVKSVHDEYLNLSTPEGLVTLIKSGNPMIPFGIEVDLKYTWTVYDIQEKHTVFQFPNRIVIDRVLTITDYDKCPRFRSRPRVDSTHDVTELASRLECIYQLCLKTNKLGGILTYLGKYEPQSESQRENWSTNTYGRMWPRFETLVVGIVSNNDDLIRDGVCGLLGVGQGLTPSGDDFLLGFLCGLRDLGIDRCLAAAEKMAYHLLTNSPIRTTSLSAEYIKYGVKGFYHKRIIDFIEAFNMGSISDMLMEAESLMDLGHFSGVDLMTGFAYGGLTALQADIPSVHFTI